MVLYVDGMLLIGNKKEIKDVKTQLSYEFDMKDLSVAIVFWAWKLKEIRKIGKSH